MAKKNQWDKVLFQKNLRILFFFVKQKSKNLNNFLLKDLTLYLEGGDGTKVEK